MPERSSRRDSRLRLLLLCTALFLLPAGCFDSGREVTPLRIGYMICNSLEETQSRFEPLSAYIGEQLGREVRSLYMDTVDFGEAVSRNEFDIIHTNSLLYIWFHEENGFRILSGERRGRHGLFSAGSIVVHAESDIESLDDLKGRRFVFGPQLAPTAFLTQYYLLLEAGVDPEKDLGYYAIPWGSFKHEKVVYGVWFGHYDAGAVPVLDLDEMERTRKVPLKDLRIIAEGPPVPYCVFSAAPSLSSGTFAKIQSVLFGLTADATAAVDGEAVRVLKSAGIDGFEPLDDSEFDLLRTMARRARLPPYTDY